MALQTSTNATTSFKILFLFAVLSFCMLMAGSSSGSGPILFAEASSSADATTATTTTTATATASSKTNHNLNKMFKGMSPGMQQKMSFLALTTSKIDAEQKAAIRKQFQRTFQKRST